jgi:hypothetical protein
MNFLAGLAAGVFAFVFMTVMTTFIMGKDLSEALLYAVLAAAMMFVVFGFMARTASADVTGATPEKAAGIIAARFKTGQSPLPGGGLRLTGGANFFWTNVDVVPTAQGITLTGPANILTFMKTSSRKRERRVEPVQRPLPPLAHRAERSAERDPLFLRRLHRREVDGHGRATILGRKAELCPKPCGTIRVERVARRAAYLVREAEHELQ